MGSVNRVFLLGRLGRDPEVKMTQGGQQVASFTLATSEAWTGKDGKKEERTEWHRCQAWGKQAEAIGQYMRKGSEVCVEGSLQTRSWEKDGQKHYVTEIKVQHVTFVGGKKEREQVEVPEQPVASPFPANASTYSDDDTPF